MWDFKNISNISTSKKAFIKQMFYKLTRYKVFLKMDLEVLYIITKHIMVKLKKQQYYLNKLLEPGSLSRGQHEHHIVYKLKDRNKLLPIGN